MAKGDTLSLKPLSLKQRMFIEAYVGVSAGNATDAARRAGYRGNDKTLEAVGRENLAKPRIAEAVSIRVDAALESMSADEVIAEIASVAKSEWSLFSSAEYDRDGNLINVTLRLGDKLRALELLGKYHKLFTEEIEHTGKDGGPIQFADLHATAEGE